MGFFDLSALEMGIKILIIRKEGVAPKHSSGAVGKHARQSGFKVIILVWRDACFCDIMEQYNWALQQ